MRISLSLVVFLVAAPMTCLSQEWEFGGAGGYGWYSNPSIKIPPGLSTPSGVAIPPGSAEAGFPARGNLGVVFGENLYRYVGGEIRYLFQFGGPQLKSDGLQTNMNGHTNLIVYDFLFHMRSREERLRPFIAGGAGIKVFTSSGDFLVNQPLQGFARLVEEHTQVEPAISVGVGLKYRMTRHVQLRADFRTYFSPLPDEIFRRPRFARLNGWVYEFVPMAGISYVF
jgi:hypothetical protein